MPEKAMQTLKEVHKAEILFVLQLWSNSSLLLKVFFSFLNALIFR